VTLGSSDPTLTASNTRLEPVSQHRGARFKITSSPELQAFLMRAHIAQKARPKLVIVNKKTLLGLILAAAPLALSSARAADLTVYYSFAEVRDAVSLPANGRFDWTPPADLGSFLVPGSLELEYPELLNMTLLPPSESLLKAFEGREVLLKQGDAAPVRARVVRADIGLFEVNGQFLQASAAQVIYPSLEGVRFAPTYSWQFGGAGGNATLTYLTRGVSWTPRYTLTIKGDAASLNAWADVKNASAVEYTAPKTNFLAGQVNIAANDEGFARPQVVAAPSASFARAEDSVQASGELGGLQTFVYAKPITLAAKTTTSVPFVNTKATLERILDYSGGFTPQARLTLPLNRVYNVKTDSDLPGGVVTVREDNRVVGQARIPDSPKAEVVPVNLGADFDLRLTRTAQTLERTQQRARYKVNFSLVNTKTRPVTVRLQESLGQNYTLDQVVLPNVRRDEGGFTSQVTLQPNQRLEASYTITYRFQ
jgi:hypothetical protein